MKDVKRGKTSYHRTRLPWAAGISGQISIVAAALIGTTFFLFFAFVVNTGMLVHAKINLQNAADMAAYAGAATQARQLDRIGILNYEMRRQYKRFLFRYYVLGNLYRPDKPGSAEKQFGAIEFGSAGAPFKNLGVPAVCLVFKQNDNYCRVFNNKPIESPKPGFIDAIGNALEKILKNIEEVRKTNCTAISEVNLFALQLWLFNVDPEGAKQIVASVYQDPETQAALRILPLITRGLGVVPRNLLLHQRIKTLAEIINQRPERNLSSSSIAALEKAPQPMQHERTILAFRSAERTLGSSLYEEDSFTLDELLPQGPESLLALETTHPEFNAYSTTIQNTGTNDCRQRLYSFPITGQTLPVAVSKRLNPKTFYAVRLRGQPKLLFNPFGDLTLEAYAAARPFGSRLGPQATAALNSEFTLKDRKPEIGIDVTGNRFRGVPSLPLVEGDALGWYSQNLFNELKAFILTGPEDQIATRIYQAEAAAALPNKAEYGRYITATDFREPDDSRAFQTYFLGGRPYSFYAPLSLRAGDDGGLSAIQGIINGIGDINDPDGQMEKLKPYLKKQLEIYFTKLKQGNGENGEGLNIVRIVDLQRDIDNKPVPEALFAQVRELPARDRTPWYSGFNAAPFRTRGNVGYSVKFVSFQSLGSDVPQDNADTEGVASAINH